MHAASAAARCLARLLCMAPASSSTVSPAAASTAASVGPCCCRTCRRSPSPTGTSTGAALTCGAAAQAHVHEVQRKHQPLAAPADAFSLSMQSGSVQGEVTGVAPPDAACPPVKANMRTRCLFPPSPASRPARVINPPPSLTHQHCCQQCHGPSSCLGQVVQLQAHGGCRAQQQEGALQQAALCTCTRTHMHILVMAWHWMRPANCSMLVRVGVLPVKRPGHAACSDLASSHLRIWACRHACEPSPSA
jgi:hypothetical protein